MKNMHASVVVALVAFAGSAASAQTFATQDFESNTAGDFFGSGVVQGAGGAPMDTFDSSGDAGLMIMADPTGSGRGNVGMISQPNARAYVSWDFATAAGMTFDDNNYIVSFDVYFPANTAGSGFTMQTAIALNTEVGNALSNFWPGAYADWSTNGRIFHFLAEDGSSTSFTPDWTLDRWLNVRFSNMGYQDGIDEDTFLIEVFDGSTGDKLFCDVWSFRTQGENPTEHRTLDFRGGCCSATGSYFIDNLQIEAGQPTCVPAPGTFDLNTPNPGGYVESSMPLFDWDDADNVESYSLIVSTNSDLSDPIVDVSGLTESEFQSPALGTGTYFVEVRATNGGGDTVVATDFAAISPCLADNSAPFSTLNAADVNAFVNSFLEGCP